MQTSFLTASQGNGLSERRKPCRFLLGAVRSPGEFTYPRSGLRAPKPKAFVHLSRLSSAPLQSLRRQGRVTAGCSSQRLHGRLRKGCIHLRHYLHGGGGVRQSLPKITCPCPPAHIDSLKRKLGSSLPAASISTSTAKVLQVFRCSWRLLVVHLRMFICLLRERQSN